MDTSGLATAKYHIPGAKDLVGLKFGDKGKEVLKLQKLLALIGAAYGSRFKFDGVYGKNMLGAILYTKYVLAHQFGVKAKTIAYGATGTLTEMKRSADINADLMGYFETILHDRKLNGKDAFVLPSATDSAGQSPGRWLEGRRPDC